MPKDTLHYFAWEFYEDIYYTIDLNPFEIKNSVIKLEGKDVDLKSRKKRISFSIYYELNNKIYHQDFYNLSSRINCNN